MEILIAASWAVVFLLTLVSSVAKMYLKNNFPGLYHMMYASDAEFDHTMRQIRSGFRE